jgi:hypothetical protein
MQIEWMYQRHAQRWSRKKYNDFKADVAEHENPEFLSL